MDTSNQSIPDKLYFRIGEVAKMIGVEPYVLRYWETEFPEIAPVKSKARQRLYKRQDVELIYRIRDLLYQQNFTIKGAKKKIKDERGKKSDNQIDLDLEPKEVSQGMLQLKKTVQSVLSEMDQFLKT